MLQLPNDCSCSEPSIYPKNWNKSGISIAKNWYVQYYFYDPIFKERFPKGYLSIIKGGLNKIKTHRERKDAANALLKDVKHSLVNEGYNPILGRNVARVNGTISKDTNFIYALRFALEKVDLVRNAKLDVKSIINGVEKAAKALFINTMPIGMISRKDFKAIFEYQTSTNPKFSANRANNYRSYLSILYKELLELECVEINPLLLISKKKVELKPRELLTPDERTAVDVHLKKKNYNFWRFVNIFFHSGSRITEMLKIQAKDVDLVNQRFRVLVKKGRSSRWPTRTIKDVVLPLWEELLKTASQDSYIFSRKLQPGPDNIRREQVTRRWEVHVKRDLGITADIYSLKHSNLDETAAALDIEAAAAMAGHTTPIITMKHYALNEKERQLAKLQKVNNSFS